jgi:hypothetical protein
VDLKNLHRIIFATEWSVLAVNNFLPLGKICRLELVLLSQYTLSTQQAFVAHHPDAQYARNQGHGSDPGSREEIGCHRRMPTSTGTSLRRPILQAASIAARVGTNPSATHAIDSKISIGF